MSTILSSTFTYTNVSLFPSSISSFSSSKFSIFHPTLFSKSIPFPYPLSILPRKPIIITTTHLFCKSPDAEEDDENEGVLPQKEEADEWIQKLPEKNKPLYSHSLPCIEAWLKSLGFHQSNDDRAKWLVHKHDWHGQLSLDLTEVYIRYLKSGPGNLEKDVERKFSYALSREDIENAVLGGP